MNAIIRRSPNRGLMYHPFYHHPSSLFEEVDALAREMWESSEPVMLRTGMTFGLDIYEEKDDLVVKTELPGVKHEDLDISLEDGILTVKAEKKQEETSEDTTYYTCERHYGKYSRSIKLPFNVESDKISANFENGVLEIRLPKAEEAKPKRIEVKPE